MLLQLKLLTRITQLHTIICKEVYRQLRHTTLGTCSLRVVVCIPMYSKQTDTIQYKQLLILHHSVYTYRRVHDGLRVLLHYRHFVPFYYFPFKWHTMKTN